ncbi:MULTISPECIES: trypsin-like serine peptidase [Vibrio]|uniref:trypsin-like serine peptidase n=1 Tax=Vibrio TaxID=662 RepID=UPI0011D59D17|nr:MULTISPECIES: trypsin-like peptidase domain-containing protein [Vibrio]MDX5051249.1 trypsin-like peptidase domain-containing protein [Vibrio cholerae]TXX99578.1 trypsin-like peptidase domain-containing protein [Vibrio mimicus]TYW40924.1 trypsin-like peptidase domain-containing protein [Vibrio cholerae]
MEIKQKQEGVYPLNIELPSLKSLFIEMYFGEQLLSSGTATLISNTRESHCALVTNRHNVTGRHQQTGECLSPTLGVPDNIVIHFHRPGEDIGDWIKVKLPLYREDGSPFWIEHPRLGEKADIVALNLNWGSDVLKIPYYLKLDLDRVGMVVSPAEPVSVIGFPFGMSTSGKLPVWATGFLAQELSLISEDDPVFLIDCRTRQGQSGSPVIAFRTSGYRTIKDNRISATLSGRVAWEFLGIYSGRVNAQSDLGRVWHVSALEELLNAAERVYKERNNKNDEAIVK